MVSSSDSIPIANPDNLSIGDTDALVNKYLNEEAIALNHPEKAPSSSPPDRDRHRKASSDEKEPPRKRPDIQHDSKPKSAEKMNSNAQGNAGNDGNSNSNANGTGAKPRGTRSVSKLSAAQLARKRANDREAQRAIRQRTKEHIENLERQIRELSDPAREMKLVWEMQQRNQELEREVTMLKSKMASMQMAAQTPLPSTTGQSMPTLGMTADGTADMTGLGAMGTMDWPQPLNITFTGPDNLTGFEQPLGSTKTDPTTPGVDMPPSIIGTESGLMTPYPRSPTGGPFSDMTNGMSFDPLPGAADDLGLGSNMAPSSLPNTANYQMSNQMRDPNMFSPPYMYVNANGMPPYDPYTSAPQSLPSQMPQQMQSQMSNQQQMQNQQAQMQNQQSQISNGRRRSQQAIAPAPTSGQSANGMVKYNISPVSNPNQLQIPPQQQQPQASPMQQQQSQQSVQSQPQMQPPQLPSQPQQTQQHQQQSMQPQQMNQPRHPPPIKPRPTSPRQQVHHPRPIQPAPPPLQSNGPPLAPAPPPMTLTEPLNAPPPWARPPIFTAPSSLIDSLLHTALQSHRQYVLSGGPNPTTPCYLPILSAANPSIPPSSTRHRYSPLSDTITRAIQVAGFKDIATQAGTLYLSYVFLRWTTNPLPETWGQVPPWLRPGTTQLNMRHPVWASMLNWPTLRERIISEGGRYISDEFVLCYARNLVLEWNGGVNSGRNLTGNPAGDGTVMMGGKGFDEGVFELGSDGEVRTTDGFLKAVGEQGRWALRGEFFGRYPELGDLARRAVE